MAALRIRIMFCQIEVSENERTMYALSFIPAWSMVCKLLVWGIFCPHAHARLLLRPYSFMDATLYRDLWSNGRKRSGKYHGHHTRGILNNKSINPIFAFAKSTFLYFPLQYYRALWSIGWQFDKCFARMHQKNCENAWLCSCAIVECVLKITGFKN